jgi:glycosyltransferase involved in cell wall biosynthesis
VLLLVCGEGSLAEALARRVRELGVQESVELVGYVPVDDGLGRVYGGADAFLHVSWTEGVPQVLVEAAAAGLPIVATAVGGVTATVGDAALLIPPGDAEAAAAAVCEVLDDALLRERLIRRGAALARAATLEAQSGRLAAWLRDL